MDDARYAVSALKLDPGTMEERTRLADAGDDDTLAVYPRTEWPILVHHPVTGEQLVFTSEQMTSHVVGLDDESSEALLQLVFSHLYAEQNLYVHRWEPGDLIVWDNLALHHSRNRTAPGERRAHRRVAVGCGKTLAETVASARGERAPELLGAGTPST